MKFFYPLVKSTLGDCEEFKYSLRSLETNFKDNYEVYICGYVPKWLDTSKVTILPTPTSSTFRMQDSSFKLLTMAMSCNEFVWIHDDMYLLSPQTDNTIKQVYYLEDLKKVVNFGNKGFQQRLKQISDSFNSPQCFNFATHTPMFFNSLELIETIEKFNYLTQPKLYIETVHYNHHRKLAGALPVRLIKVGRYDNTPITDNDFVNKFFCNFDEAGLASGIFDIVKSKFSVKSRFELS